MHSLATARQVGADRGRVVVSLQTRWVQEQEPEQARGGRDSYPGLGLGVLGLQVVVGVGWVGEVDMHILEGYSYFFGKPKLKIKNCTAI
jgi:hypothetical protein